MHLSPSITLAPVIGSVVMALVGQMATQGAFSHRAQLTGILTPSASSTSLTIRILDFCGFAPPETGPTEVLELD